MSTFCLLKLFCLSSFLVLGNGQQLRDVFLDKDVVTDVRTVQEKWGQMESRIQALFQGAVKMLMSRAVDASASLNISSGCMKDALKIIWGLRSMKIWALKFIDASTKLPDGMLNGTLASFGDYQECVNIKVMDERSRAYKDKSLLQGKYCFVYIRPYLPPKPKDLFFGHRLEALQNFTGKDTVIGELARVAHLGYAGPAVWALCIPSGCSENDINQVLKIGADYMGILIKVGRCEVKRETEFTIVMIFVITLYTFTAAMVLLGTAIEFYTLNREKKFSGTGIRILTSFSFISNYKKLASTSESYGSFSCLNGMKVLTISWILLSHTYLITSASLPKLQNAPSYIRDFVFQFILNGTFAVDTFFVMSGTLLCYNFTKAFKISKIPFSIALYVVNRLWRIWPVYSFVIAFYFILPLLGSGPLYFANDISVRSCEKYWWASLLFITNYYGQEEACAPHGWYLTLDMQYYISALALLLPLMRWPKVGITLTVSVVLASMVGSWVSVYIHDLPPVTILTPDTDGLVDFYRYLYAAPHGHAMSYCIGILCGYLLAMHPKLSIPKTAQFLGWCLSTVVCVILLGATQKWNSWAYPTFWESVFYPMFSRATWSLCIAWIITCCSTGHGGIVNDILSWKAWVPMGRLTFLVYLIHPLIMVTYVASMKTEFGGQHHEYVWLFFGNFIASYLAAFAGAMLVEAPSMSLKKVIFPDGKKEAPPPDSQEVDVNLQKGGFVEEKKLSGSSENETTNGVIRL